MKRLLSCLLTLALLLSLSACGGSSAAQPSTDTVDSAGEGSNDAQTEEVSDTSGESAAPEEGAGEEADSEAATVTEDGYIHITCFDDFARIREDLSGRYILDTNIDNWSLDSQHYYTPIGTVEQPFTGELNGNGFTVSGNLDYTGEGMCWGLFGCNMGSIHDLNLGTLSCPAMEQRELDYMDEERTYADLAGMDLPSEQVQFYGLLCGVNAGTLEHITMSSSASYSLLHSENRDLCLGVLCGYNVGQIRDVTLSGMLYYRTMDDNAEADVGLVCGHLGDEGSVKDVHLEEVSLNITFWFDNGVELHLSPRIYAGLVAGAVERGCTIGSVTMTNECILDASYSLEDAELLLGGVAGYVDGDFTLENVDACVRISCDVRDDLEGYEGSRSGSVSAGGLIGFSEHDCTLSNCTIRDSMIKTVTRAYERSEEPNTGGVAGGCGGDLVCENLTVSNTAADLYLNDRDGYLGGVCGWVSGNAILRDCDIATNTLFEVAEDGTLFNSNVIGYCEGDASFDHVDVRCSDGSQNGGMGVSRATYYCAAMVAGLEGDFHAEDCTIDVFFSPFVGNATIYDATDHEGMYNPA